jgi:hypothetical protein
VAAAVRLYLVKENIEKVSESAGAQIRKSCRSFMAGYSRSSSAQRYLAKPSNLRADAEYLEIMFVIIEPNCSVIAGCVPCYGHLWSSGGRRLHSIVDSARSAFTLRSHSSAYRSQGDTTKETVHRAANDSQVGLSDDGRPWANNNAYMSSTRDSSTNSDRNLGVSRSDDLELGVRDIQVTKGFHITSH